MKSVNTLYAIISIFVERIKVIGYLPFTLILSKIKISLVNLDRNI